MLKTKKKVSVTHNFGDQIIHTCSFFRPYEMKVRVLLGLPFNSPRQMMMI